MYRDTDMANDTQTIMIRKVPRAVHDTLHHLAIDRHVSLNTLLLEVLVAAAAAKTEGRK